MCSVLYRSCSIECDLCVRVHMCMCACLNQCIPESVEDFTCTGANAKCLEPKI